MDILKAWLLVLLSQIFQGWCVHEGYALKLMGTSEVHERSRVARRMRLLHIPKSKMPIMREILVDYLIEREG